MNAILRSLRRWPVWLLLVAGVAIVRLRAQDPAGPQDATPEPAPAAAVASPPATAAPAAASPGDATPTPAPATTPLPLPRPTSTLPATAGLAAARAAAAAAATNNLSPIPSRLRGGAMPNPFRSSAGPAAAGPVGARPGVPGGAAAGSAGSAGGAGGASEDELDVGLTPEDASELEEGDLVTLNFPGAPLETALDLYAGLVRRVLLRPPTLAGGPITLKFTDLTREEAIEALNGVFALNGISVIPVGEKFMKVVPSQQATLEGAQTNETPAEEFSELGQFVTKLVKVTKVKPGDIAQAVQQFASTKVANPVLVFDDQNFFILRDMAPNVKRMVELIKELDVTVELDYKLEVIPIRYGKVDEIYETLSSVVTGQGGGGVGGASRSTRASGFRSGTTGGGGVGGVGGMTGSPFTPQQSATSTLGARPGGMTSPGAARSSFGDRLRAVSSAAAGGAQYNLLEDARIIPDMRSNSLLVYANKEDFKMLTNIVAKIDTLLAQVLIESIILEVGLETGKDFGVSMVQNPKQFGGWTGASGSVNDAALPTNGLAGLFPPGFSFFGQYKSDFALAFQAIATDNRAKVLARPRIQTTHAQTAQFEIGDTVPYPQSTSPAWGGVGSTPFTTYQEKRVTTRLMVTPFITPDGLVTLEVEQVIDQLGPTTRVGQDEIPTIRTRSASAVLSIRDQEPVILGGFITDRRTDSVSGVPWLKDIPLLGWAFRSKNDFKQRSELIVLIRPTILDTPQEASRLAEIERRSLPNATAAVREFQSDEAAMAERLGVIVPGNTNALPESAPAKERGSRRKRDRQR